MMLFNIFAEIVLIGCIIWTLIMIVGLIKILINEFKK